LLRRLPEVGAAASAVSVLWLALNRGLPPAEAAGALAALAILVQPLRDLATVWDYRCAWMIARNHIVTLFSVPTLDPPDVPRASSRERAPAHLALKGIRRGAVRELDAVAEPGMKVAIIGPNGAGKSTCLALAAGLDAADAGVVELDGRDLAAMPVAERRRSIVFVGPRSPILKGSLRRSLTLGISPRPADSDIEQTALDYGLGAVLERLRGLDGKVAEAGRNLSSGEALRLHLVRAALAKPRLFCSTRQIAASTSTAQPCSAGRSGRLRRRRWSPRVTRRWPGRRTCYGTCSPGASAPPALQGTSSTMSPMLPAGSDSATPHSCGKQRNPDRDF
jgi:ATP-binding cassette subfamily B protein/ATP-binding cassette subfamily C protein CydC